MKTVRHIILCVVGLAAGATLSAQPYYDWNDTIFGRQPDFYTPLWYDQCLSYLDSSLDLHFMFRNLHGGAHADGAWSDPNPMLHVAEFHAPCRMAVQGLAAMVAMNPAELMSETPIENMNRLDEYMILLQGMSRIPGAPAVYPPHMVALDTVRWDNVFPDVWRLPESLSDYESASGTENDIYCYVYKAYFQQPVLVDSLFYVAGTHRSTIYNWDSAITVNYLPTIYQCVVEMGSDFCQRCRLGVQRLFVNRSPIDETYWSRLMEKDFAVGPFIPIVDFYHLEVSATDTLSGYVEGGGYFPDRSLDTIRAVPYDGYVFERWNDGVADNPRVVDLMSDTTFVAIFVAAP